MIGVADHREVVPQGHAQGFLAGLRRQQLLAHVAEEGLHREDVVALVVDDEDLRLLGGDRLRRKRGRGAALLAIGGCGFAHGSRSGHPISWWRTA
jgi:hypothetical protein